MLTLAHQLRDLPGFRWAPGMLGIDPTGEGSPIRITARGECVRTAAGTSIYRRRHRCHEPADPAWIGSGTGVALLYCGACARLINRYNPGTCSKETP